MDGVKAAPHCRLAPLLALAVLIHFSAGISQVSRKVKEMATLSCSYNLSTDELSSVRLYWQKDSHMVLSIISGAVKVWPEYRNRTFADIMNNLSLVILALRVSDKGTYTCVIQKLEKGSYRVEHLNSVKLIIRADFAVPTITECEHPSPDLKRIRCSTSGGFPKPHLSWRENGEELSAFNTTVFQDPQTELYSISSELDFNGTNHSFVCLIKYGDSAVSETFHWPTSAQETVHNRLLYLLIIPGVSFAMLLFHCMFHLRW